MDQGKRALSAIAKALFLILNCVIGASATVWYFDSAPPYVWNDEESFVTPNPAPDGGRITADWMLDARRLCPGVSQRTLRDGMTIVRDAIGQPIPYSGQIVATYDKQPLGAITKYGDQRLARTFVLPRNLPPVVNYSSELCFRCNPLQYIPGFELCVKTPELQFRVTQSVGRESGQGP